MTDNEREMSNCGCNPYGFAGHPADFGNTPLPLADYYACTLEDLRKDHLDGMVDLAKFHPDVQEWITSGRDIPESAKKRSEKLAKAIKPAI